MMHIVNLNLQDDTLAENNTITYFCCSNGVKVLLVVISTNASAVQKFTIL
jgi:hypothetical protein